MKKKAKGKGGRRIDIAGMKHGKLTAVRHCGHGNQLTRCECGAEVIVNTGNFKRGLAAKDCGRVECRPVDLKYAQRRARYIVRNKAWDDLMDAFGELMKRLKCTCNRNVKPCRECARLRTAISAGIDARLWISTDPSFDKQMEPVDPRDTEHEPDEDIVSRKAVYRFGERAYA